MNVKRLRTARGLTQIELAKKTKVSQAFIAQLETGEQTNPTLATLQRLAKALKVSVRELIPRKERKMDAQATCLLESFAVAANIGLLHHEDRRRFYDFAIDVHRRKISLQAEEIRMLLMDKGFPEDKSERLGSDFENLVELLERYDAR